jgi:broad specificity phosphatase PhoE
VARLHLVRHGRAAAGWDADPDPGLDELGRAQAEEAARRLAGLGPLPILCSPLRRTRETAAPLAVRWGVQPRLDARVGEIPSPTEDLAERGAWLQQVLAGTWSQLGAEHGTWRDQLLAALLEPAEDTVVVTHFVAVNAVLGAAASDDRLVVRAVANASCTVVDTAEGRLRILEAPDEASTEVL